MTPEIQALFEAHVAHELARLRGERLTSAIEQATSSVFAWLSEVRLEDLLSPAQVLGIIERYVIALRISGGITELAGQISQVVFAADAARSTRLDQMLTPEAYEEFADKVASLDGARREVLRLASQTAAFRAILARLLTQTTMRLLMGARDARGEAAAKTGLGALLRGLGRRLGPTIEGRLEAVLARYYERHAERLIRGSEVAVSRTLDAEAMRALADEIWESVSQRELADVFGLIDSGDLEDFVVLGYECWQTFRKTPYFRSVCGQVVDMIFAKYGDESVLFFLEDMGVTEDMVRAELATLYAPIVEHAAETGLLERQVRARLEPFYRSAAVASLLGAGSPGTPTP